MKIVELQPDKFDQLVKSEPNANFYQTSNWANYYSPLGYTPLYLGYEDKNKFYYAFAMILIKKGFFLSKKEAICPSGFIINYFDTKLLQSFTIDLKKYLNKKHIKSLKINPNVNYVTSRINNDFLIKKLEEFGYQKINNSYKYRVCFSDDNKAASIEELSFNTYCVNDENHQIFKKSSNYSDLYKTMGNICQFVVCELNIDATINNLKNTIDTKSRYIEENENANSDLLIDEKKQLQEKQELLQEIERYTERNDSSMPLAITCLIKYGKNITQLFIDTNKEFDKIDATIIINNKIEEIVKEFGYNSYDSAVKVNGSITIDLIGEFVLNL